MIDSRLLSFFSPEAEFCELPTFLSEEPPPPSHNGSLLVKRPIRTFLLLGYDSCRSLQRRGDDPRPRLGMFMSVDLVKWREAQLFYLNAESRLILVMSPRS
jgi:hypothetical protein